MNDEISNRFDLDRLRLDTGEVWAVVPGKIKRRREYFVKLPMTWYERLRGANGQTYRVAWFLLYQHWRNKGEPFKVPNGMLAIDGVPPRTKCRALRDLVRRDLICVEWRKKKSPIVRVVV